MNNANDMNNMTGIYYKQNHKRTAVSNINSCIGCNHHQFSPNLAVSPIPATQTPGPVVTVSTDVHLKVDSDSIINDEHEGNHAVFNLSS